jgi:hypothetical protein
MARNKKSGAMGGARTADCHSCKTDESIPVLDEFDSNKAIAFNWHGTTHSAKGRDAWALWELIRAGAAGCTVLIYPSARLSAYIHTLRTDYALSIETLYEVHDGPFKGVHGRYVLRAKVRFSEGNA